MPVRGTDTNVWNIIFIIYLHHLWRGQSGALSLGCGCCSSPEDWCSSQTGRSWRTPEGVGYKQPETSWTGKSTGDQTLFCLVIPPKDAIIFLEQVKHLFHTVFGSSSFTRNLATEFNTFNSTKRRAQLIRAQLMIQKQYNCVYLAMRPACLRSTLLSAGLREGLSPPMSPRSSFSSLWLRSEEKLRLDGVARCSVLL